MGIMPVKDGRIFQPKKYISIRQIRNAIHLKQFCRQFRFLKRCKCIICDGIKPSLSILKQIPSVIRI